MNSREARLKFFENEEHHNAVENNPPTQENVELLDEEEALRRAMELSIAETAGNKEVVKAETFSSKKSEEIEAADYAAAQLEVEQLEAQGKLTQPEIHKLIGGQEWEEEMVPVPVDESLLSQLVDMGFPDTRGRKAIIHGKTLEGALEWLTEHEDDPDIDQPYMVRKADTIPKPPLSSEERAKQIEEVKNKIKKRREDREKLEKAEEIRREKERRERGQKMDETLEERQKMMRKREAERLKKEKEDFAKERQRLKAELARDKEIRKANKGVLPSVLGVEGYNPPIIQYDVPVKDSEHSTPAKRASDVTEPLRPSQSEPAIATKPQSSSTGAVKTARKDENSSSGPVQSLDEKIDSAISTISRYRTGGDGGQALKLLTTFLKNIVDHPDDPKYKAINIESAAFKTKLAPLVGPLLLLKAIGFEKDEADGKLKYGGSASEPLLVSTLAKLVNAEILYRQQNPS